MMPGNSNSSSPRLPTGDPCEAFRLSEYLQGAVSNRSSAMEAEYEKLRALMLTPQVATTVDSPVSQLLTQVSAQPTLAKPSQGSLLTRQRRRQREQWWLWGCIGGLACVGTVLGGYFWFQANAASKTALSIAQPQSGGSLPASVDRFPSGNSGERRSGLPSVSGLSPDENLTQGIEGLIPMAPSEPAPSQAIDIAAMPDMPAMPDQPALPNQVTLPNQPAMAAQPATADMSSNVPPAEMSPAELPPADLTDQERTAWATALQAVKQQLGEQQYELASQGLVACQTLAKTSVQRAQLERLKSVGRLAQELQQAMQRALDKLGAGEVITIGTSTPVSFVDWRDGELTMRIRGQNRKFRLTDVPIGLAYALADLSLDAAAPTTQARKAAFALVHPGAAGNDLATQRAREMMLTAVAAGVVDEGLEQVFDDDYALNAPRE